MSKPYQWALCATLPILLIISAYFVRTERTPTPMDIAQAHPVETTLHDFMEFYNKPPYERLLTRLPKEVFAEDDWKAIQSDCLILAESGNLLIMRPQKDHEAWTEHASKVRDAGAKLFESAKKKEITQVRLNFDSMLNNCNACHQQFAIGMKDLPHTLIID